MYTQIAFSSNNWSALKNNPAPKGLKKNDLVKKANPKMVTSAQAIVSSFISSYGVLKSESLLNEIKFQRLKFKDGIWPKIRESDIRVRKTLRQSKNLI